MQREIDDIQSYIGPQNSFDTAKMLHIDHQIATIFVEGDTDKDFFKITMGESTKIRYCPAHGWEGVYGAVNLAIKQGDKQILGIIDRDYHELLQDGITENEQLIFTDYHDIEMMLFMSSSYIRFLTIFASEEKLKAIEDKRTLIMVAASYLGALRALSLQKNYCLDFDEYKCKDYVDHRTLLADVRELVKKVVQRTNSKGTTVNVDVSTLALAVQTFVKENKPEVLCNGHDVLEIIGIAMRKVYATADSKEYPEDKLFRVLLQGYSVDEFQKSELYRKINSWLKNNVSAA